MKRHILWIIIPLCIVLFPSYQITHAADLTLNNTPTKICFSPQGGCTEAIIKEIIQSEALVNLLERKGIISKEEFLEEIKKVQAAMLTAEK